MIPFSDLLSPKAIKRTNGSSPRKTSFNLRPSWTFEDPGFRGRHARTIASCYLMRWIPPHRGWGGLVVVVVVATQTVFMLIPIFGEMIQFERGEVVLLFFPNKQSNFWRKGFVEKGLNTSKTKITDSLHDLLEIRIWWLRSHAMWKPSSYWYYRAGHGTRSFTSSRCFGCNENKGFLRSKGHELDNFLNSTKTPWIIQMLKKLTWVLLQNDPHGWAVFSESYGGYLTIMPEKMKPRAVSWLQILLAWVAPLMHLQLKKVIWGKLWDCCQTDFFGCKKLYNGLM